MRGWARLVSVAGVDAATGLGLAGAALSFAAAAWLLFGFNPDNPKYRRVEGGGYTPSEPTGLYRLLREQSRVAAVATLGAACQFAAVLLQLR